MAVAASPPAAPRPQHFTLIAHRGDSAAAPENTLPAFDAALAGGCASFETDAQLSADGAVVLLHNEQLGRTNDGAGAVAGATLAQLQALDAGAWFGGGGTFAGARIPALADVLLRYRGRAHIHLELKSKQPGLPAAVAALVQQHGWDQLQQQQQQQPAAAGQEAASAASSSCCSSLFGVPGLTITSFHLEQLLASRQVLPRVPHGWLIQEVTPELVATAAASGLQMLCPRASALTPEATQLITEQGLAVRAWGVRSIELLLHVVDCGVHGATVNWPAQAAEALRQRQQQHAA